jgi:hypothetical protein
MVPRRIFGTSIGEGRGDGRDLLNGNLYRNLYSLPDI